MVVWLVSCLVVGLIVIDVVSIILIRKALRKRPVKPLAGDELLLLFGFNPLTSAAADRNVARESKRTYRKGPNRVGR